MAYKETINLKSEPLRHGWGGDLKRRDRILKEREEERQEMEDKNSNNKWNDFVATREDYLLLEEMTKRH